MHRLFEACCRCSRKAKGNKPQRATNTAAKFDRGLDKPTFLRVFARAGEALERHGLEDEDGAAEQRFWCLYAHPFAVHAPGTQS